ncbi:NUDIX domain-containing protein [Streptosporangium sp. CA-115845]|uniref:NUDIX domain-containing protein n=1 Tax=Streptosporangium sp. CA-115845 TaxID=3240071 RepID=UPI003D8B3219
MKRRPEPGGVGWNEYLAEGNARQARKRVTADVLLRDAAGRLLLVRPTYKEGWDLPGGMAEANESPTEAARRELSEELGLDIPLKALLCVDWVAPHGPWDDLMAFVFDGGILTDDQCGRLRLQDEELSACTFFEEAGALDRLPSRQRLRTAQALAALKDHVPRYLENGIPMW